MKGKSNLKKILIILTILVLLFFVSCVTEADIYLAKCNKITKNENYSVGLFNSKTKNKVKTSDIIRCQKLCYKGYR